MKRFIIGLTAALALVFVGTARADDTKTTEKSTTQKSTELKDKDTAPTTDTGMGGSGSTTKTEKKSTKEEKTKTDDAKAAPPAK